MWGAPSHPIATDRAHTDAMARVRIDNDTVIVEIEGLDRLWALKKQLTIPVAHLRAAVADPAAARKPRGIRAPGTYVPGRITAGTYRRRGERTFWDVHDPAKAVVIDLREERYARLIVQVDDPYATVDLLDRAITRSTS